MPARVLSGNRIRDQILAELEEQVLELAAGGVRPGLAAILAGDNPASKIYVRNKIKACGHVASTRPDPSREIPASEPGDGG